MSSLYSAEKATLRAIKRVFAAIGNGIVVVADIFVELEADPELSFERKQARDVINNMRRRGEIVRDNRSSRSQVKITRKGRDRYRQLKMLESLDEFQKLASDAQWDGKWRVIIYDIPEQERSQRNLVRGLISRLGCELLQQSVWVTPFDCEEQVARLHDVYGEMSQMTLLVCDRFEGDERLVEKFNLE